MAVIEAFESGVLDLPDFYFTGDDYRYRFEPEAKERFLDLLRERSNKRRGRAHDISNLGLGIQDSVHATECRGQAGIQGCGMAEIVPV